MNTYSSYFNYCVKTCLQQIKDTEQCSIAYPNDCPSHITVVHRSPQERLSVCQLLWWIHHSDLYQRCQPTSAELHLAQDDWSGHLTEIHGDDWSGHLTEIHGDDWSGQLTERHWETFNTGSSRKWDVLLWGHEWSRSIQVQPAPRIRWVLLIFSSRKINT